ncbi:MAG: hypothetical protein SNJ78_11015 [Spirochaetales bacterium]
MCRNLVREQGGTISFESRPGYTRFTVTLPSAPSSPPQT